MYGSIKQNKYTKYDSSCLSILDIKEHIKILLLHRCWRREKEGRNA